MMHLNDFDTSDVVAALPAFHPVKMPPAIPLRALSKLAHLRAVEIQLNASTSVVR